MNRSAPHPPADRELERVPAVTRNGTTPNPLEPEERALPRPALAPGRALRPRGRAAAGPVRAERDRPPRRQQRWLREVGRQLDHPLALLLWAAAVLAWFAGTPVLSGAIVAVIVLNAGFALLQERQAERAVEALAAYLPDAGRRRSRRAAARSSRRACLVPGDVVVAGGGRPRPGRRAADRRAAADRHLGADRRVGAGHARGRRAGDATILLEARDLVFSGTSCTGGQARALVFATGMQPSSGASPRSRSGSGARRARSSSRCATSRS